MSAEYGPKEDSVAARSDVSAGDVALYLEQQRDIGTVVHDIVTFKPGR